MVIKMKKIQGFGLIEFCVVLILTGVIANSIGYLHLSVNENNAVKVGMSNAPGEKLISAFQVLLSNIKSTGVVKQPDSISWGEKYANGDFPFSSSNQVASEKLNYSVDRSLLGDGKPSDSSFDPSKLIENNLLPVADGKPVTDAKFAVCLRLIKLIDNQTNNSSSSGYAIMISEKENSDQLAVSPYQLLKSSNCIARMSELAAMSKSYLALRNMYDLSKVNEGKYSGDQDYYNQLKMVLNKKLQKLDWQKVNYTLEMNFDALIQPLQIIQEQEAVVNVDPTTSTLLKESFVKIAIIITANTLVISGLDKAIDYTNTKIKEVDAVLAAINDALPSAQLASKQINAIIEQKKGSLIKMYSRGISE